MQHFNLKFEAALPCFIEMCTLSLAVELIRIKGMFLSNAHDDLNIYLFQPKKLQLNISHCVTFNIDVKLFEPIHVQSTVKAVTSLPLSFDTK